MKKGVFTLIAISFKRRLISTSTNVLHKWPKTQAQTEEAGCIKAPSRCNTNDFFKQISIAHCIQYRRCSTALDKKKMPIRLRIEQSINDHWNHQLKKSKKYFLTRLAYGHSNTSRWNWLVYAIWHRLQFFCTGCWQSGPQFNWQLT